MLPITTTRQKILVFLAGAVLALLVLEVGLRVAASVFWRPEGRPGVSASALPGLPAKYEGAETVLCVGDSFTYGMGASVGHDYPSLLEGMLQAAGGQTRYMVINGGKGGANSSMLLSTLPDYLEVVKPGVVTLMLGGVNMWDYSGYMSYKNRHTAHGVLYELAHEVRILRLVSQLLYRAPQRNARDAKGYTGIRDGPDLYLRWWRSRSPTKPLPSHFEEGLKALALGQHQAAATQFSRGVATAPGEGSNYWGMGFAHREQRRLDQARMWFKKGIEVEPGNPNHYFALGRLCYDQMIFNQQRIGWFRKGIRADPSFGPNYCLLGDSLMALSPPWTDEARKMLKKGLALSPDFLPCYEALIPLYRDGGKMKELRALLRRHSERNRVAASYLAVLEVGRSQEKILSWIKADLNRAVDLSLASGARVILQLYPHHSPANQVITAVARERSLPLVKHLEVFNRVAPEARMRLFLPDNHCSDEGNRLIARTLAHELLSP